MRCQRYIFAVVLFLLALLAVSCRTEKPQEAEGDCRHDYVFSDFEWEKEEAFAVYTCKKDPSHTDKRKAEVTKEILKEATPSLAGQARLTALYEGHSQTVEAPYMADEVTFTVYAVNDFHGAIEQDGDHAGLLYFGSYFREKGQDENTLLLDQGDTWQGSILSNYNYGALISNVYNYVRFDAKTLGNHEFDWGVDVIAENRALTSYGYRTPYLAANVYDYDFISKTEGSVQQSQLGDRSVCYTLASGLKVGIVGVIGFEQITSINSIYTQKICFLDHVKVIKEEARALRENGCDVVICSIHAGQEAVMRKGLEEYVDLFLCAHTHQLETGREGHTLYAQFGANGENFGKIDLTYRKEDRSVTSEWTALSSSEIVSGVKSVDLTILSMIKRYKEECEGEAGTTVASKVNGSFSSSGALPNLMCRAVYDAAVKEGYDVCLAYVNKARATLSGSRWTYEDLYRAFPFDDIVYIADVTGRELLDEVFAYNYVYIGENFRNAEIDPNARYRIACVDYLFFHTNSARRYDYFPRTAGMFEGALEDNYRVILRDWLISGGYADGKELSADEFSSYLPAHHR